jgi:hypothetical protein
MLEKPLTGGAFLFGLPIGRFFATRITWPCTAMCEYLASYLTIARLPAGSRLDGPKNSGLPLTQ